MNKLHSTIAFALLWLMACVASAQQVMIVSVTANGYGRTEAQALSDAVINGVAQVNGETVAASMRVTTSSTASTSGGESGSRTIEEDIQRRTRGVVKAWKPLSVNATGAGDFSATAQVSVAVLKRSEQLKRMKLAIVPSRRGDPALSATLAEEVVSNLTTSRKFAIMDRKNNYAIASQLNRIRTGDGAIEDQVRLTGEVAPDFLVVVTLDPVGRNSAKPSVVGSLEVIDYSSRQVKFSEKKSFPFKVGDDSSNRRRIAMLGKGLSRAVIQTVYPPIVVGMDEGFITIGQGSDFFNKGDVLVVKKMGNAIRDPHTGEFLSNEQTELGKAEITYVDERIARAKVSGGIQLDPKLIAGKKYQVWRTGESTDDFFAGLSGVASSGEGDKKSKKLFVTDDDDDN
jgi:hypothetical protein